MESFARKPAMGILDQRADNWFGVCEEYVAREFGKTVQFRRSPHGSHLNATLCVSEGGGDLRCFNLGVRTWDVMEDDEMYVQIALDGLVSVGYSLMDQADYGMVFKVGHPREVAELFHLLLNPAAHLKPEEECLYGERKLGEIAEFRILIPDGETWRIVDPSNLPQDTPEDFRKAFHLNLSREWNHFTSGATHAAWDFAGRWPDFVKSLPVATSLVRAGYVLDLDGYMKSAVNLAVVPPACPPSGDAFFDMLIIPSQEHVSSLYLREVFNHDKELGKRIEKAFSTSNGCETMMAAIKAIALHLPLENRRQIRLAAEQNAIRQWLLSVAERVATQRGGFSQADRNWHLAHALSQMRDTDV